jgi:hypothetical protein
MALHARSGRRPAHWLTGTNLRAVPLAPEHKAAVRLCTDAVAVRVATLDSVQRSSTAAVELYWIPLSAGGHSVRFNGRAYEAIVAAWQHRTRCDLYHAALVVQVDGASYAIEVAPSPDADEASRGVVAVGPVGSRLLRRLRLFRYEVRCWPGGAIPDRADAVDSPKLVTTDPAAARRIVELTRRVPTPVWGRDELGAGEMWNSNSVAAWLITAAGLGADVPLPVKGRAPGWHAGEVVASRSQERPLGHDDSAPVAEPAGSMP